MVPACDSQWQSAGGAKDVSSCHSGHDEERLYCSKSAFAVDARAKWTKFTPKVLRLANSAGVAIVPQGINIQVGNTHMGSSLHVEAFGAHKAYRTVECKSPVNVC